MLTFAGENRVPDYQLCEKTAKRPHIDSCSVRDSKDNLWCSVEARLNVCVNAFILQTGTSVVDHLDSRFARLLQQDILRLQVAMHNSEVLLELEGLQNLNCKPSDQAC